MRSNSSIRTLILTLVIIAGGQVVRYFFDENGSAKGTMCVVTVLIMTALIIHGATYSGDGPGK